MCLEYCFDIRYLYLYAYYDLVSQEFPFKSINLYFHVYIVLRTILSRETIVFVVRIQLLFIRSIISYAWGLKTLSMYLVRVDYYGCT